MIDQVTVFLENEEGHLSALCRDMGRAGVNMHALTIADTSDYGVVRIICSDPQKAVDFLRAEGYRVNKTPVMAVSVSNESGGLAKLLDLFDGLGLNIEYGYCFSMGSSALNVLKVAKGQVQESAIAAIEAAGFSVVEQEDL